MVDYYSRHKLLLFINFCYSFNLFNIIIINVLITIIIYHYFTSLHVYLTQIFNIILQPAIYHPYLYIINLSSFVIIIIFFILTLSYSYTLLHLIQVG